MDCLLEEHGLVIASGIIAIMMIILSVSSLYVWAMTDMELFKMLIGG